MRRFFCAALLCLMILGPQVSYGQEGLYPENVFSSQEICSQYFERCEQNIFEEIDGESVMTVAYHPGVDWMYSKTAVAYETYTVSFDFALTEDSGSEGNLLFAMTGDGNMFHQISFVNSGNNLYLVHYAFTGDAWITYEADHMMFASYEGDSWCHMVVEFMPEEINVYVDDEYALTLSDTPDYSGDNGYIGFRCGSLNGFKLKNFTLTEGIAGEEPTDAPMEITTEIPEEIPSEMPTVEATKEPANQASSGSGLVLGLSIAGVLVLIGGVGIVLYMKKRG